MASPFQGVINFARDVPVNAYGAIRAASPQITFRQGIEEANRVIPRASFATRATQRLIDRGALPNFANTVTKIGEVAGPMALGGIGRVKALELAKPIPRLAGYSALRSVEGAGFNFIANTARTGDLKESARQIPKDLATGALVNTALSPRLTKQAFRQGRDSVELMYKVRPLVEKLNKSFPGNRIIDRGKGGVNIKSPMFNEEIELDNQELLNRVLGREATYIYAKPGKTKLTYDAYQTGNLLSVEPDNPKFALQLKQLAGYQQGYIRPGAYVEPFIRNSSKIADKRGRLPLFGGENAMGYEDATGKFSNPADKKVRFEIDDSKARLNPNVDFNRGANGRLGDIFDHQELYKNYPDAADIKTNLNIDKGYPNPRAEYNPKTNEITVWAKDGYDAESQLLHEIQHAIQEREGFARGGSPEQFKRTLALDKAYKELAALREGRGNVPYSVAEKRIAELEGIIEKYDPQKRYQRLTGEVEARDVQTRMNLTPEQRSKTQPYASQGIMPQDQIVRFEGESTARLNQNMTTDAQTGKPVKMSLTDSSALYPLRRLALRPSGSLNLRLKE
jgi:hypothetical protein